MDVSKIVLNRGLRQAVLAAAAAQGLSMSEIAVRCGRVKHDSKGKESGETSWLARRLGIAPEGGESTPTPWIHSDVLALIARRSLESKAVASPPRSSAGHFATTRAARRSVRQPSIRCGFSSWVRSVGAAKKAT